MSIVITPIPSTIELAAPAFTLGTANTAGAAVTAVSSNSTLLAFDAVNPAPVGTVAVGSATVGSRRDHVHSGGSGVAKAWGRVTDAGANESPVYNLATTGDTGTGDRTINFTVAFSSTVYSALATTTRGSIGHNLFDTFAEDSVRLRIFSSSGTIADYSQAVAFFGDQ